MLGGDPTGLREAGLHVHQHRVTAAVAVEHLFAGEGDLDRPAELEGHLGDGDLVAEDVALAAEAAAVGAGDDPDARRRQPEHPGHLAVHVVRRLGRGVEGDLVVVLGHRHRRVLLDRQVGVALVVEGVLERQVSLVQPRVDVAELEGNLLVDVAAVTVVVNPWLRGGNRLGDAGDGGQRPVVDLDRLRGGLGLIFGQRRHRYHRVADHAHLVQSQGVLVERHRQDAEGDG